MCYDLGKSLDRKCVTGLVLVCTSSIARAQAVAFVGSYNVLVRMTRQLSSPIVQCQPGQRIYPSHRERHTDSGVPAYG